MSVVIWIGNFAVVVLSISTKIFIGRLCTSQIEVSTFFPGHTLALTDLAFLWIFQYILRRSICRCIINGMNVWNVFKCCCVKHVKPTMNSVDKNDLGRHSQSNCEFIDDVWLDLLIWKYAQILVECMGVVYNKPCSHKSKNSNLVFFSGVGVFEQLFDPGRGGLNKNLSEIQMPGKMLKLRVDWYIYRRYWPRRILIQTQNNS